MTDAKRPLRRSMTQVRRDDIAAGVRYISYRAKPRAAQALQALCDARAAAGMDSSTTATIDAAVAGELARMTTDDSMPVVERGWRQGFGGMSLLSSSKTALIRG